MRIVVVFTLVLAVVASHQARARVPRSTTAKHNFQSAHPCPSTGKTHGRCAGYIIDHRIALCVGGTDTPDNMRWQTFDNSILKDRWECKQGWQDRLAQCEAQGCFASS